MKQNAKNLIKIKLILVLFFITISSQTIYSQSQYAPDNCSEWTPYGKNGDTSLLFLKTCQSADGAFGYLEIKNETDKHVTLVYVLNFNNKESITGTVTITDDDKTSKIICPNCIEFKGNGILSWSFEKIVFEEKSRKK